MTVLARPGRASMRCILPSSRVGDIFLGLLGYGFTLPSLTRLCTPLPDKADCCYRYSIALGNLLAWVAQVVPFTDFQ